MDIMMTQNLIYNVSERMMARTALLTHIEIKYLEPDLSYKDGRIKGRRALELTHSSQDCWT